MSSKSTSFSIIRSFCTSKSRSLSYTSSPRAQNLATPQSSLTGEASTVARGTAFEHFSSLLLNRRFGIQLQRVGGAGDRGIDLKGWWYIPSEEPKSRGKREGSEEENPNSIIQGGRRKRLRVIAQCKAEAKKLGPVIIREFEGTLHRAELQDRLSRNHSITSSATLETTHQDQGSSRTESNDDESVRTDSRIIGILLSSSGFSKQSALQAMSSPNPLLLIHLEAPDPKLHAALTDHFEAQDQDFPSSQSSSNSELMSEARKEKPGRKKKELDDQKTSKKKGPTLILETPVCLSVMANQAFLSRNGALQGRMDIRWERIAGLKDKAVEGNGRPLLYWDGKRVEEETVRSVFGK